MIDLLVRLYDLPNSTPFYARAQEAGFLLRRARAFELHQIVEFVRTHFSEKWASEVSVALSKDTPCCFIATKQGKIYGFACHDTTARGFFGPTGVDPVARGNGLGQALLLKSLEDLAARGYAYAIIGGVGPREFYEKTVGAVEIPGSTSKGIDSGFYRDILPETAAENPK